VVSGPPLPVTICCFPDGEPCSCPAGQLALAAVILDPKDYAAWLDQTPRPKEELLALLRAFPSEAMKAGPVSTMVNSPRNQGPGCIEPLKA
jgi:hypothetical protein